MRYLDQDSFRESEDRDLERHSLVIHRRTSKLDNTALILFVHGLNGTRYRYWGQFCHLVSEDYPTCDVGLYFYRTALRRRFFAPTIDINAEARTLAATLQGIQAYSSIFIVTHSMGGILAKGALAQLLQDNDRATLRRIAGLLLIASPQAGSARVPHFMSWSPDARALRRHNDYVRRVDEAIRARLTITDEPLRRSPTQVPMWALLSEDDFWVDPMSAALAIPIRQRHTIHGDHGALCSPIARDDDCYAFATKCLRKVFTQLQNPGRSVHDIRIRIARPDDAQVVSTYATKIFGPTVSGEADIEASIRHDPTTFHLVHKVVTTGLDRRERLIGYFCVLRLSSESTESLVRGALLGSQIEVRHLVAPATPASSIYVGAVAADGPRARAAVLGELKAFLAQTIMEQPLPIYARPVSAEGLRVVQDNGFIPLKSAGVNHMYGRKPAAPS